jgi:hypothetical protein
MEKVVDVDFHLTWTTPFFVQISNGMRERVDGPDAASSALLHRWPSSSSRDYEIAKSRCVAATTKRDSVEFARTTFVEAAIVAMVLA